MLLFIIPFGINRWNLAGEGLKEAMIVFKQLLHGCPLFVVELDLFECMLERREAMYVASDICIPIVMQEVERTFSYAFP